MPQVPSERVLVPFVYVENLMLLVDPGDPRDLFGVLQRAKT
jgi:hypothetical protein